MYAIELCYLDVVILGEVERVELLPGNGLLVRGDTVHRGVGWGRFEEGGEWIAGELEETPYSRLAGRPQCNCDTCRGGTRSDCRCVATAEDGVKRVINCRGLRLHVYLGAGDTASVPTDKNGNTETIVSDVDYAVHKLTFDRQFRQRGGHEDPPASAGYVAGSVFEGRVGPTARLPAAFPCTAQL